MLGSLAPVHAVTVETPPTQRIRILQSLNPGLPSIPPLVVNAEAGTADAGHRACHPTVFDPPAAPMPPSSKVPEFAKPPTDEKYFKQLKRF